MIEALTPSWPVEKIVRLIHLQPLLARNLISPLIEERHGFICSKCRFCAAENNKKRREQRRKITKSLDATDKGESNFLLTLGRRPHPAFSTRFRIFHFRLLVRSEYNREARYGSRIWPAKGLFSCTGS